MFTPELLDLREGVEGVERVEGLRERKKGVEARERGRAWARAWVRA